MSRRHAPRLSVGISLAPGIVLAGWGWHELGEPFRLAGLGIFEAAALIAWPLLALFAVFGLPAMAMGMWPREWRKRARHGRPRPDIPRWFRRVVFSADRYRCVACGNSAVLHIDHFMPWSLGGLTSLWNCLSLCQDCNLAKSNAWYFGDKFWPGMSRHPEAARYILACERRRRHSVLRWLRVALALAA